MKIFFFTFLLTCICLMGSLPGAYATKCRIAPKLNLEHSDVELATLIDMDALALLGSGKGITVAVIDTGLDLTNDEITGIIQQNLAEIPGDGVDNDMNGYVDDVEGWNLGDNNNSVQDIHGHGTQVSSIIRQLAPDVTLLPIKVTTGTSEVFDADLAAQAILYAIDAGADIINMSFTAQENDLAIENALKKAAAADVVTVGAAGNSGGPVEFPAQLDEVIAVGSATSDLTLSGFSSWGDTLDLLAPGEDIEVMGLNGEIEFVSGTSFSTPVVSAVAAVLLSMNSKLKAQTVKNLLFKGALDILAPGVDNLSGYGAVNGSSLYAEATPSVYPIAQNLFTGGLSVGVHTPPTDTPSQFYIVIQWQNNLYWLTPQGDWKEQTGNTGTAFVEFNQPGNSIDLTFYGAQGVFPSIMMDVQEIGDCLWGLLITDMDNTPLAPATTTTLEF